MADLDSPLPTSRQLFHDRLAGNDAGALKAAERTCRRAAGPDERAPAEIVTWRQGPFHYMGVLIDPSLGDVPIEAEGWFRWSCKRTLLKKHEAADRFGKRISADTYING